MKFRRGKPGRVRIVEDNFFRMVFVIWITSVDKSNLEMIPTHMLKNFDRALRPDCH